MKTIAIVTGGAGGFGREFVKLMQKEELDEIWVIGRNREKLAALVNEFGNRIKPIAMDLTHNDSIESLKELVKDVSIKYLVNNAGYAKFCAYDELSLEDSLNMIDLNIKAVVALGLISIEHMNRGSVIINIASQASFFPLPYMNIYAASKAFVRNYTRALNVELKDRGIHAIAVCPGWMNTALFERASVGAKKNVNNFFGITDPEAVAQKAMKDAKRGKEISTYGAYVKLSHLLSKIAPQKTAMKIWLKQQGIK